MPTARRRAASRRTRKRRTGRASAPRGSGGRRRLRALLFRLLLVSAVLFAGLLVHLDMRVRSRFEGRQWSLPARVYAAPVMLYAGRRLAPEAFAAHLARLGYRRVSRVRRPGEYARDGLRFEVYTHPFRFWDGEAPAHHLHLVFGPRRLERLTAADGRVLDLVRLEPERIASLYPGRNEDRELVRLEQVPTRLLRGLLAVEDREFLRHHGVSLRAILRALVADLRAGAAVQGGSTITQQLVRNLFLDRRRTLTRKLTEALMALLLEAHYDKRRILETYVNEVYLGQDGARAIHGFALASRFYFDRPLKALSDDQIALLVGLVRGPAWYDPFRHPRRARARRNQVLDVFQAQGILTPAEAERARRRPLGVVRPRHFPSNAWPAFIDLVRRQLLRDYRREDLERAGLRIFTTLDPLRQAALARRLPHRLRVLERRRGLPAGTLQAAVIVTGAQTGDILALAGDRGVRGAGFNRALAARRPVGSLIKPFVYLEALAHPDRYTLATRLQDRPLVVPQPDGTRWRPQNYDRRYRGAVLLHDALVQSLNVPTVRLGLALGARAVIDRLRRCGLRAEPRPWPSLFLGAVNLTPLEVTALYQTLANGGFRTRLRAIRAVTRPDGSALQRYPIAVRQVIDPRVYVLIDQALRDVVREGTARLVAERFPGVQGIAGKTGTTDDLRDSWFAGYDGRTLTVVWVGRDDDGPTGLTGAGGALQVWLDLAREHGLVARPLRHPRGVEWHRIDRVTGLRAGPGCRDVIELPFLAGSAPRRTAPCAAHGADRSWWRSLLGGRED
ncbi:MAG: penicillin-binding protein 1B [Gammaproteobacteria bacterium]|nr:MAG: penicillin-binding protein 1B [Gammaproteobacteria bacterium]